MPTMHGLVEDLMYVSQGGIPIYGGYTVLESVGISSSYDSLDQVE